MHTAVGSDTRRSRSTAVAAVAAVAVAVMFAVQAVVLAVLLVVMDQHRQLPVIATFRVQTRATAVPIATIDLGWAMVALLAGAAITLGLVTRGVWRPHLLLLAGWSQGSGVLVYLVAQLNGIVEVTSLVPLYAIAAVAVALQGLDPGRGTRTWRRSGAWAAALGIVPWGVIAFAQIGAGIAVGTTPVGVRIVTLLVLVVAVYGWWLAWREPASVRTPHVLAMTAAVSLVVWTMVVLAVLPIA